MPEPLTMRGLIDVGAPTPEHSVYRAQRSLVAEANKLRYIYGMDAVDIVGKDTWHYFDPDEADRLGPLLGMNYLEEVVRHCAGIGLRPTVEVTGVFQEGVEHAEIEAALHKFEYQAGVDGWIIDLRWLRRATIDAHLARPIRWRADTLDPIGVGRAADSVACSVMLFEFPKDCDVEDKLARYAETITELAAADWKVYIRDVPLCLAEKQGLIAHVVNWPQAHHVWLGHALETVANAPPVAWKEDRLAFRLKHQERMAVVRANPRCHKCVNLPFCLGPRPEYLEKFGGSNLVPYSGRRASGALAFLDATLVKEPARDYAKPSA